MEEKILAEAVDMGPRGGNSGSVRRGGLVLKEHKGREKA